MSNKLRTAQSICGSAGEFGREVNDFYATPDSAIRALLSHERFDSESAFDIWEPCCGDGAICRVAEEFDYDVTGTDLIDRGYGTGGVDFLKETTLRAPSIVTNPPYRLARPFIEKALDLGASKAAFLLRLQFLEGQRRKRLLENTPLARIYVFSKRIPRMHNPNYTGKKTSSLIAFAWFVWDRDWRNNYPIIQWINPVEKQAAI